MEMVGNKSEGRENTPVVPGKGKPQIRIMDVPKEKTPLKPIYSILDTLKRPEKQGRNSQRQKRKNSIFNKADGGCQESVSSVGGGGHVRRGSRYERSARRFSTGSPGKSTITKSRISLDNSYSIKSTTTPRRKLTSGSEDDSRNRRLSVSSVHGSLLRPPAFSLTTSRTSPTAPSDTVFDTVLVSGRTLKRWSSQVKQGQGNWGSILNAGSRATSKVSEPEAEVKVPAIQTFRRVAKLVKTLVSVCIALRSYAIGKGLLDEYLVSISHRTKISQSDNDSDELTFNLEHYKIKKELEVPESTRMILGKVPDERTPSDIDAILRLMRELPSFRKYTRDMQLLFCRIVRYMRCSQNRVVLRKGHIGYNLYFIFTGTCSVVLDKDEKSLFVKKEVIILKKGACFGEIALVQNTRRNATVVCNQDTEFLVVDKDLFLEKGLNHQVEEEFKVRFNVFRNLKILSHWDSHQVKELSNVSRMEEFGYNRIIVKDSKLNDWLWFVVKGSCDIIRLVDLERCDMYKRLINDPSPESRASLETLTAATRGSVICTDTGSVQTGSAWTLGSENKAQRRRRAQKPATTKADVEKCTVSEADIGRIDDMLHNLREHQVSEVLLSLKERQEVIREKEKQKEKEEEILESLKEPGSGLFFKVDTLRDCQCFGMASLIPKKKPLMKGLDIIDDDYVPSRTFTLVSRGCEVIHVPKTKFKEIADKETMDKVAKQCKIYPQDDELCQRFIERCNWNAYKREVTEEVILNRERSKGFEARLRSGKLRGQDIARAKRTGDESCDNNPYNTSTSPPPGTHPPPLRPHTAFISRKKGDTKSKELKSSWEMSLEMMERSPTRIYRPSTCPPCVSKQKHHYLKKSSPSGLVHHKAQQRQQKPATQRSGDMKATTGYQVDGTNVFVRGSHRTLQLISGVTSPGHEYRLNKLGTK